jgi:23S rRNA (pseudouridine1915-N3)-methyltransferase
MKTGILVVGRLKDRYLEEGIESYLARLRRYAPVELIRLPEEKKHNRESEAQAVQIEGERILSQIRDEDTLIALSEEGKRLDSATWALQMRDAFEQSRGRLLYVIGSGAGLCPRVKQRANLLLSLSPMTFPHQIALLLLTEQIYRAWTILHNEPYHR